MVIKGDILLFIRIYMSLLVKNTFNMNNDGLVMKGKSRIIYMSNFRISRYFKRQIWILLLFFNLNIHLPVNNNYP